MTPFRIHFVDGSAVVIDADTPKQAADRASEAGHASKISKIKIAKDVGMPGPIEVPAL